MVIGVLAAVSVVVLRNPEPRVTGLAPAAVSPFDDAGTVEAGPSRAWFSPDGTKLAVLSAGALGLAREGRVTPLTRRGGNVVDAAWFSAGTALLVAEGPAPTGGLVVVETDGDVRGTIALEPVVSFGTGLGMSVAPGGKAAVVTAVERDPLGAGRSILTVVDLTSGRTEAVDTGPGDARGPHHVDGARVAFTRVREGRPEAVVIDMAAPGRPVVLGPGEVKGVVGSGQAVAVQDGASLLSYPPAGGRPRALSSDPGGPVVAVQPSGTRAVIAVTTGDAVVLRAITLSGGGST